MLLYRRRCSCRRVSQHGRGCLCYRSTPRCSGGRLSSTTQTQRRPASWRQLILITTSASYGLPIESVGPAGGYKLGCDMFAPCTACAQSSAFLRGGGCQTPQIISGTARAQSPSTSSPSRTSCCLSRRRRARSCWATRLFKASGLSNACMIQVSRRCMPMQQVSKGVFAGDHGRLGPCSRRRRHGPNDELANGDCGARELR